MVDRATPRRSEYEALADLVDGRDLYFVTLSYILIIIKTNSYYYLYQNIYVRYKILNEYSPYPLG